jgi:EAL domain-containing protein (putative c-di-GMP-specific phosphodiesterase class I)/GGDEF domain-containing protein
MSMYRQLWLAIILSTLLALLGSLFASTLSARSYLSEQLSIKNADNAAALALSLSQQNPDVVAVELAVSALFDSGHYELIRIVDPFGKPIVERSAPAGQLDVPAWFTAMLPIVAEPGRAQISDGWKQFGTIELVSHSRFAYRSLWSSVFEMVVALAIAGLIGGYLGSLVLRRLRQPLDAVIDQAQAIAERRFTTIPEPKVPELRSLAVAMNGSVARIKTMFEEEASRLEAVRRDANCDPLTGLGNRNHFLARLRANLADEESGGGSLVLVRIARLAEINHRLGREATDEMLTRVGHVIARVSSTQAEGLGARLNGADYALLLPGCREPMHQAEALLAAIVREAEPFVGDGPAAFIGVGQYGHGLETGTVLARVDAALAAAEASDANKVVEADSVINDGMPRSREEWSSIIRIALEQRRVHLGSFPVTSLAGKMIHRECPLRLALDDPGKSLPAGRFLPMAERMKLTPRLDLAAVSLGLDILAENPAAPDVAINLSASSIQDEGFRNELIGRLRKQPKVCSRLWLEVAEAGVLHHLDAFRTFVGALRSSDCHVGIEHFGRQFSQIGLLHDLGLDYIKVDASFIHGLDGNAGNRAFLKGVASIAHGIGLTVIAEGVATKGEFESLKELGFDGATGPAIKDVR